ncbi:MAG: HTTM domain-containing protein, partial [Planctomycetaceae bacterium]
PRFHFAWYGFGWVQVLSPNGMRYLFVTIGLLAALVTMGLMYRLSSLLVGLAFCYVFLIDQTYYQNHYYLLSMVGLVMPLLPAHRLGSVDCWIRPALRSPVVPGWSLFLVRFLVGIPYFYGGIAKMNADWLAGQPARMMLADDSSHWLYGRWATEDWLVYGFCWGGMLFDLLIVPALLWRRTRLLALVAMTLFHLSNASLFTIGVFPWFMIAATLVFLPAGTFRRLVQRPVVQTDRYHPVSRSWQSAILVALGLFVAFHMLFPLRHHLYAGNVHWTEHGHYFSWRMKLRGKKCVLQFQAFDPVSGAKAAVNPKRWLTPFQGNRMARSPKLVHDFARFLKQEYAKQGYPATQIRVILLVSLNGRKPQLMIDPAVDLGSLPRLWGAPSFVLPLTEPLRRAAWDEPRGEWIRLLPPQWRDTVISQSAGDDAP